MATNNPGDYNIFQNTTWTGSGALYSLPTFGSTGSISFGNILTTDEARSRTPEAISVSVMADGYLLINSAYGQSVRVPPSLFKDLVTLATLGLVEKLAPQEAEDGNR